MRLCFPLHYTRNRRNGILRSSIPSRKQICRYACECAQQGLCCSSIFVHFRRECNRTTASVLIAERLTMYYSTGPPTTLENSTPQNTASYVTERHYYIRYYFERQAEVSSWKEVKISIEHYLIALDCGGNGGSSARCNECV